MNLDIKVLTPADLGTFQELLDVFDHVFEYKPYTRPDSNYLVEVLRKDGFIAVVATVDNQTVAGLTAYVLTQYHSTKPLLYIHDLAVFQPFQRKGIGSRLLEFLKEHCVRNGFQEMYLQAELEDKYALDFYRSTGPSDELQAVNFNYMTTED
ncbi:GNAT family N-acetyltransferase [Litoribacter ruber]|uniref:GNAT family N-acetyltransferase n=1 Tax=Litoribacter ruber TaxID=702568 RepID=UPI001BD9CB8C|nr:GNAT family N-acetyltransferase [Litoribacter ruber]MBT0811111.1 GNAT family N-acetyltransferase [Litoribacter ruber]